MRPETNHRPPDHLYRHFPIYECHRVLFFFSYYILLDVTMITNTREKDRKREEEKEGEKENVDPFLRKFERFRGGGGGGGGQKPFARGGKETGEKLDRLAMTLNPLTREGVRGQLAPLSPSPWRKERDKIEGEGGGR